MIIFNGIAVAKEIEMLLVKKLNSRKAKPTLAIVLVGNDKSSKLYTGLKQKVAQRIGINSKIYKFKSNSSLKDILSLIAKLNLDKDVNGIMLQLPLPKNLKKHQKKIINSIDPRKDVDGLRDKSLFTSAAVRVTLYILEEARVNKNQKILVVGSKGEVGSRIVKKLKQEKYSVKGIDAPTNLKKHTLVADVIISAVGKPDLIKESMVGEGVVAIDIGSPKADFEKSVYNKASFITPVPGGVGPLTIIFLLDNIFLR